MVQVPKVHKPSIRITLKPYTPGKGQKVVTVELVAVDVGVQRLLPLESQAVAGEGAVGLVPADMSCPACFRRART